MKPLASGVILLFLLAQTAAQTNRLVIDDFGVLHSQTWAIVNTPTPVQVSSVRDETTEGAFVGIGGRRRNRLSITSSTATSGSTESTVDGGVWIITYARNQVIAAAELEYAGPADDGFSSPVNFLGELGTRNALFLKVVSVTINDGAEVTITLEACSDGVNECSEQSFQTGQRNNFDVVMPFTAFPIGVDWGAVTYFRIAVFSGTDTTTSPTSEISLMEVGASITMDVTASPDDKVNPGNSIVYTVTITIAQSQFPHTYQLAYVADLPDTVSVDPTPTVDGEASSFSVPPTGGVGGFEIDLGVRTSSTASPVEIVITFSITVDSCPEDEDSEGLGIILSSSLRDVSSPLNLETSFGNVEVDCVPLGICCDTSDYQCRPDVEEDQCTATSEVWTDGGDCAVDCVAPTGSCCTDATLGTCTEETQADCNTAGGAWVVGGDCAEECPAAATGACCDRQTGVCDVRVEDDCSDPRVWTSGALCADACGVCCGANVAACSYSSQSDCADEDNWVAATAGQTCETECGACCDGFPDYNCNYLLNTECDSESAFNAGFNCGGGICQAISATVVANTNNVSPGGSITYTVTITIFQSPVTITHVLTYFATLDENMELVANPVVNTGDGDFSASGDGFQVELGTRTSSDSQNVVITIVYTVNILDCPADGDDLVHQSYVDDDGTPLTTSVATMDDIETRCIVPADGIFFGAKLSLPACGAKKYKVKKAGKKISGKKSSGKKSSGKKLSGKKKSGKKKRSPLDIEARSKKSKKSSGKSGKSKQSKKSKKCYGKYKKGKKGKKYSYYYGKSGKTSSKYSYYYGKKGKKGSYHGEICSVFRLVSSNSTAAIEAFGLRPETEYEIYFDCPDVDATLGSKKYSHKKTKSGKKKSGKKSYQKRSHGKKKSKKSGKSGKKYYSKSSKSGGKKKSKTCWDFDECELCNGTLAGSFVTDECGIFEGVVILDTFDLEDYGVVTIVESGTDCRNPLVTPILEFFDDEESTPSIEEYCEEEYVYKSKKGKKGKKGKKKYAEIVSVDAGDAMLARADDAEWNVGQVVALTLTIVGAVAALGGAALSVLSRRRQPERMPLLQRLVI